MHATSRATNLTPTPFQEGGDDPLPLKIGDHSDTSISNFPDISSGKVTTEIEWRDQDNEQILCLTWTVQL